MKEKLDSTTYLTIFAVSFIGFLIAFFLGVWVGGKATKKPERKTTAEKINYNDYFNPAYEEINEKPVVANVKKNSVDVDKKVEKKKSLKQKNADRKRSLIKKSGKTGEKKKNLKSKKKTVSTSKTSLKKKTTKTTRTVSKEQRYMLQIGAYKRLRDANKLKLRFEKKGYSVFIIKEKGKKSVFYKVRIGTFYSKKIAYKVKKKIEREDKIKAWLVPIK